MIGVVAATAVGLALRLYRLTGHSLWLDETNGINAAAAPLADIIPRLSHDTSPPLYYFLLHGWIRLFGEGELSVRLMSVAPGVALIPVLYLVGRAMVGQRAALFASFLVALSPLHIEYSQEVRMYSFLCLVALWSLAATHRAADDGTELRPWFSWAASALVLLYTHYWTVFLLAAESIFLVVRARRRLPWMAAHAVIALGYLPWLPVFLHQMSQPHGEWMPRALPLTGVRDAVLELSGGDAQAPALFLLAAMGALNRKSQLRAGRATMGLLAVCAFFPLFASAAASFWLPTFLPTRYPVIVMPAFALFVGAFLARVPWRTTGLLVGALTLFLMGWGIARTYDKVKSVDRRIVAEVIRNSRPGDVVIMTGLSVAPVRYYLRQHALPLHQLVYPPELAMHPGWTNDRVLMLQPAKRREEATYIAQRAAALAGDNGRCWVFYQRLSPVNAFLRREMDRHLRLSWSRKMRSPAFYSDVLLYLPRRAR